MPGENDIHPYGGADEENRQTPTDQGFHGEGKAPLADVPPGQSHTTLLGDGNPVTVQETSGIAAAEASGKTGLTDKRGGG